MKKPSIHSERHRIMTSISGLSNDMYHALNNDHLTNVTNVVHDKVALLVRGEIRPKVLNVPNKL